MLSGVLIYITISPFINNDVSFVVERLVLL